MITMFEMTLTDVAQSSKGSIFAQNLKTKGIARAPRWSKISDFYSVENAQSNIGAYKNATLCHTIITNSIRV